ncbi:unnamed protein product [Cunninghamella blakesleeana]
MDKDVEANKRRLLNKTYNTECNKIILLEKDQYIIYGSEGLGTDPPLKSIINQYHDKIINSFGHKRSLIPLSEYRKPKFCSFYYQHLANPIKGKK